MSRLRRRLGVLLLAAVLPGCALIEPYESLEPRADDPLGTQVVKGVIYVPTVVVGTAAVAAYVLVAGSAKYRAEEIEYEKARGRPETDIDHTIFHRGPY